MAWDRLTTCARSLLGAAVVAPALAMAGIALPSASARAADVAIFQIVDIELVHAAVEGFKSTLKAKMPDATFKTYDAQGQANLFPTMARQVIRDRPVLVAVIGTPVVMATVQASEQSGSNVPIVFIAMGDPVGAGIAESLDKPGKRATGTTDWVPPDQTLETVLSAVPQAKSIGTI